MKMTTFILLRQKVSHMSLLKKVVTSLLVRKLSSQRLCHLRPMREEQFSKQGMGLSMEVDCGNGLGTPFHGENSRCRKPLLHSLPGQTLVRSEDNRSSSTAFAHREAVVKVSVIYVQWSVSTIANYGHTI